MDKKQLNTVLSEVLKTLGPFTSEVVIGGGVALLIYRYFLKSVSKNAPIPAATDDLDLLIPRMLTNRPAQSLSARLENAGFECKTNSIESIPVESYAATIGGQEIILEFLTDRRSRGNKNTNVIVAGISAQPLPYIEMSQQNSIKFMTTSGVSGQVVAPGSWIFHKALTFDRRASKNKQAKDLYGIWYAGSQLNDLSSQAQSELKLLAASYPKNWAVSARKGLHNWVDDASPRDWERLESQDPVSRLTRLIFKKFIEEEFPL